MILLSPNNTITLLIKKYWQQELEFSEHRAYFKSLNSQRQNIEEKYNKNITKALLRKRL